MSGTVTLPYAVLVPDNAKYGVYRGRALLTARYRTAKDAAATLLRAAWRRPPLEGPVALTVTLYPPDRRRRDLLNVSKLLHDALEAAGIVHDDAQLDDVRYVRGPIDRATPRAELTLTPLPEP